MINSRQFVFGVAVVLAPCAADATHYWVAPGTNTTWANIAAQCTSEHYLADSSGQEAIENTCSSDNAGSQFTTAGMLSAMFQSGVVRGSDITNPYGAMSILLPSEASLDTQQGGLNAGEVFGNVAVWGSFNWNTLDNEFANTAFDSVNRMGMVGADIQPLDNLIIGVTFGYEDNDVETEFNFGKQEIDGYTIAGYLGYMINDHFSIDGTIGHSDIDIDQSRTLSAFGAAAGPFAGVAAGTVIESEVDADRFFAAVNLNAFWTLDKILLGAHTGYLWVEEDHDSFAESGGGVTSAVGDRNFDLGQFRIGFDVAYDYKSFLEPYAGLDYLNDTTRDDVDVAPGLQQPDNDEDEFIIRLGLRYFGESGVTGALEYSIGAGRTDFDSSGVMATLRFDL